MEIHPVTVYKKICGNPPAIFSNMYSTLNARDVMLSANQQQLFVLCLAVPKNTADGFGALITSYQISPNGDLQNPTTLHIRDEAPIFRAFTVR